MKAKLRRKDASPAQKKPTLKFKRKGDAGQEAGATRQAESKEVPKKRKKLVKPAVVRKREDAMRPQYDGQLSKSFKPWKEGCVDIPLDKAPDHPQFLALDAKVIADDVQTFYTFDTKTKRVRQMSTIAPSGLRVGWSTCGRCKSHYAYCKCSVGMVHPASVEYCLRAERWRMENGPGTDPPRDYMNTGDYLRAKHREMSYDRKPFDRFANTVTAAERRAMRGEPEVKPGKPKLRRKATVDVADTAAVSKRTETEIERDTKALRKKLQPKKVAATPAPKRKLKRKG